MIPLNYADIGTPQIVKKIGGAPDVAALIFCVASTLLWARIAAVFANQAEPKTLNRATGVVLTVLGAAIMIVNFIS